MSIVNDGSEWPDFLLPPRVGSTVREDSYTVTGPDEEVLTLLVPDLDTTVIRLASGIGLTERIKVFIGYYSGDAGELLPVTYGYAVVYGQTSLVLPVSTIAPKLTLIAVSASSYNQSLVYKLVTRQGLPNTVGLSGTVPNAMFDANVAAGADEVVVPEICTPAQAVVYVTSTAAVWTLSMRAWNDLTPTDYQIASNANPIANGLAIITPATSYAFVLHNGDGSSKAFKFACILKP